MEPPAASVAASPGPAKAAAVALDPECSLQDALRAIVRNCLAQLRANDDRAARSRNSEFLHQARVALRRMRSALRLQRPPEPAVFALKIELKWLAGSLGPAREWDVLIEEGFRPMAHAYAASGTDADFARMVNGASRRRTPARKSARAALESDRYAALLEALENWLNSASAQEPAVGALPAFAARELRKRHKRLLREGAGFTHMTPEQRHRVRILAKRLRYAAEFFASLFQHKAAKRYRRELAALQDALGALNDTATARRLLDGLPGAGGPMPFIRGWLAAREFDSLAAAEGALARLAKCPRFWKSAA